MEDNWLARRKRENSTALSCRIPAATRSQLNYLKMKYRLPVASLIEFAVSLFVDLYPDVNISKDLATNVMVSFAIDKELLKKLNDIVSFDDPNLRDRSTAIRSAIENMVRVWRQLE